MPSPIVLVPACRRTWGLHDYHIANEKYIAAVAEFAGVIPLILPALPQIPAQLTDLLTQVDGVLLTGSPSNVEPTRYGLTQAPSMLLDTARDQISFPLIEAALHQDVPLLGICRGLQELNVACGGSLYPRVHEVAGFADHREAGGGEAPLEVQYGLNHPVNLVENGWLHQWVGETQVRVNSLHWQGIERLGKGLLAEAYAPDGLVEAIRVEQATFALAVQWHPEWEVTKYPLAKALFAAFGAACQTQQQRRRPA